MVVEQLEVFCSQIINNKGSITFSELVRGSDLNDPQISIFVECSHNFPGYNCFGRFGSKYFYLFWKIKFILNMESLLGVLSEAVPGMDCSNLVVLDCLGLV